MSKVTDVKRALADVSKQSEVHAQTAQGLGEAVLALDPTGLADEIDALALRLTGQAEQFAGLPHSDVDQKIGEAKDIVTRLKSGSTQELGWAALLGMEDANGTSALTAAQLAEKKAATAAALRGQAQVLREGLGLLRSSKEKVDTGSAKVRTAVKAADEFGESI